MEEPEMSEVKFDLGRTVMTKGAIAIALRMAGCESAPRDRQPILAGIALRPFLARHQSGDWGDLGEGNKLANDADVNTGGRLLSKYETSAGALYIITEHDRSVTTVLRPDEY
ncbi:hypothetical protein K2Z84_21460 [Candidatus Binatia bacterium]|nr:hypothetical protein [Candidatus Binatia bacterium]